MRSEIRDDRRLFPSLRFQCLLRSVGADAGRALGYLDLLADVIDVAKRQSMDLLQLAPGMSVVDIGCGVGRDATRLAECVGPNGRVVGIDLSPELIAEARARHAAAGLPLAFEVGNAEALAFADASFDAARVDRVLQHLVDPAQAVREMVRVVRPGGRLAALEPDWETVAVAGCDLEVTRAVVRHKVDETVAHGTIGRDLRRLLSEAGCRAVTAEQGAATFDTLALADRVMGLRRSLAGATAKGLVSSTRAEAWWRSLEAQDRAGTFYAAMCGVIAGATV